VRSVEKLLRTSPSENVDERGGESKKGLEKNILQQQNGSIRMFFDAKPARARSKKKRSPVS